MSVHQLRLLVLVACIVLAASSAAAQQVFDIDPDDVPLWDALERYRDDPICLRSAKAGELTVLPGISVRTAHRILNIVTIRPAFTFEQLSDSACLTVEQFLVLASCTTLDCSARPFVRSAWTRLRDRDNARVLRADVITEAGRIGCVYDDSVSAWLSASVHNTSLHLGAMRIGAGMGLVLGGSGGLGSSLSARTASAPDAPTVRAHTSTFLEGAFRGIAVQHADSSLHFVAGYSELPNVRNERALFAVITPNALTNGMHNVRLGATILDLQYNAPSTSKSSSVVSSTSSTAASLFATTQLSFCDARAEFAMNTDMAMASTVVVRGVQHARQPRWTCGVRLFSAEYKAPYASSFSDASYIGNEYGGFLAADVRIRSWLLSCSFDLHGSLAPRFGSPLPTRGFDMQVAASGAIPLTTRTPMLHAQLAPQMRCSLDVRLRIERDLEGWRPPDDAFTRMLTRTRISVRTEAALQVTKTLRMRYRMDVRAANYTHIARPSEFGWASYLDAMWQPIEWFAARMRTTVFRASTIDVAPYYVETDALGSMRTVACIGDGTRLHTALRITPLTFVTISASALYEIDYSVTHDAVLHTRTHAQATEKSSLFFQVDLRLPLKP